MMEMIGGNNGNVDILTNISMPDALMDAIKDVANAGKNALQNDMTSVLKDSSYIFIPYKLCNSVSYSIVGFSKKLDADARGGDFCHYVGEKINKIADADLIYNIKFFNDEGYNKYINDSVNDGTNRTIVPRTDKPIVESAVKAVVLEIFESFARNYNSDIRIGLIHDTDNEEFSAYTIKFYTEVMKHLPYALRRKLVLLSSIKKAGINLNNFNIIGCNSVIAQSYANFKLIDITKESPIKKSDFADLVNMLFSITDNERTSIFDRYFDELEGTIDTNTGNNFVSTWYLIDFRLRGRWLGSSFSEVIGEYYSNINILTVIPAYNNLVRRRIIYEEAKFTECVFKRLDSCSTVEDMFKEYGSLVKFYDALKLPIRFEVKDVFKKKFNEFIQNCNDIAHMDNYLAIASEFEGFIDVILLNQKVESWFAECDSIENIFEVYNNIINSKFYNYINSNAVYGIIFNILNLHINLEIGKCSDARSKDTKLRKINDVLSAKASKDDTRLIKIISVVMDSTFSGIKDEINKLETIEEKAVNENKIKSIFKALRNDKICFDHEKIRNLFADLIKVSEKPGMKKIVNENYKKEKKIIKDLISVEVESNGTKADEDLKILMKYAKIFNKVEDAGIFDGDRIMTRNGAFYSKDGCLSLVQSLIKIYSSESPLDLVKNIEICCKNCRENGEDDNYDIIISLVKNGVYDKVVKTFNKRSSDKVHKESIGAADSYVNSMSEDKKLKSALLSVVKSKPSPVNRGKGVSLGKKHSLLPVIIAGSAVVIIVVVVVVLFFVFKPFGDNFSTDVTEETEFTTAVRENAAEENKTEDSSSEMGDEAENTSVANASKQAGMVLHESANQATSVQSNDGVNTEEETDADSSENNDESDDNTDKESSESSSSDN